MKKPEAGRSGVPFVAASVAIFICGAAAGVNARGGSWLLAGTMVVVAIVNVAAQLRLYRSTIRLVRVQERLARWPFAVAAAWPPMANPLPPPPPPPPKRP